MGSRATLLVSIIAVVAVVGAVVVHRAGAPDAGRGGAIRSLLLEDGALPVDRLTRIRLQRAGEPEMVFAVGESGWAQAVPFRYPMDPASIDQFGRVAVGLRVTRVLGDDAAAPASLASMGLDPPAAVLGFEWPDGAIELRLGRRGFGGLAYLALSGDPRVYVVDQALHERAVDMNPREWRDRALFQGAGVDSDRIEIESGGATMVLVRDRKQWRMETPAPTRLDPVALDALLQAIGRARSAGFIIDEPGDLSRFGLGRPAGAVSVTTARLAESDGEIVRHPETQRLRVGARMGVGSEDRFGIVEERPVVVRVPEPVLRALFPSALQLAARTASGAEPADVTAILIRTSSGDLRLERQLDGWTAPDWDGREVPVAAVEQLLETITRRPAPEIELRPYPRDLGVATVSLLGRSGRPLDTVRIAREPDAEGGRWALDNGDDVLRIFPAGLELALEPEAYGLTATRLSAP